MIPAIQKTDATWYFSVVMVWSDTEVSTAIIALSLPALKGLVGAVAGSTRKGTDQTPGSNGGPDLHLQNVPARGDQHLYEGPDSYPNEARASIGDNASQEALWVDTNAGIHVKNSVRVSVSDR
ncbi:uncharacterized protein AKAW2_21589A [Aspergillus luchuensis]|nr:uncharacterized protein AKAW2_21589A [Aspergillus luchuensis]BCR96649.1 hypothetical protein AKAW2_21589A [Aspergillus luchuensis]